MTRNIFIILTLVLIACKKEEKTPVVTPTFSFEYILNGVKSNWSGGLPSSNGACQAQIYNGAIILGGIGPNSFVQLTGNLPDQVGTYTLDSTKHTYNLNIYKNKTSLTPYSSMHGSIQLNITEIGNGLNTHIKGNFNGIVAAGTGSKVNVSGSFDACNLTP